MDESKEKSQEENALEESLTKLKWQVHAEQRADVLNRIRTHQKLTEEEERLGVRMEDLEPQVRDAVLVFNKKGYSTYSSGFWGRNSEYQTIEGDYKLDQDTQKKLEEMGIEVTVKPSWKYNIDLRSGESDSNMPEDARFTTNIRFKPKRANLEEMKSTWDQIANLIPDRGKPAESPYRKS